MDEQIEGFRLSPQQRRLWLRGAREARVSATIRVEGDVDELSLRSAVTRVAQRHEALRTRFVVPPAGEMPVQVIEAAERATSALAIRGRDGECRVEIDAPAMCLDAASCAVLLANIVAEYEGSARREKPPQYADVAEWFNDQLDGADARQRSHWAARRPAAAPTPNGGFLRYRASRRECGAMEALEALSRSEGVSVEALVLACWAAVVRSTHLQGSDLMGVVREGRFPEVAALVGPVEVLAALQVAELPKANILKAARSLDDELREAAHALNALPVKDPPPSVGFRWLPPGTLIRGGGARFYLEELQPHDDPMNALLRVRSDGEDLLLEVCCGDAAAGPPSPKVLAARMAGLLASMVRRPLLPISRHPVLLESEAAQALEALNSSAATATPRLVLTRVLAHAQDDPDAFAAVSVEGSLTYAQLAERSARVAARLLDLGTCPEDVVAIVSNSSLAWLVAVIGVWRAGAACVAIDATVPVGRALFQLQHARVRVALVSEGWNLPPTNLAQVALGPDGELEGAVAAQPPVLEPPDPMGLAFVTFTSGTTGRPKGVAVEHRQMAAYAEAMGGMLALPRGARLASPAAPSVDLGATAWLVALHQGNTMAILSERARLDARLFAAEVQQLEIDVLKMTPSHVAALMGAAGAEVLPRRTLVLGGEQLWSDVVTRVRALSPGLDVINHYGPTETTVGALTHRLGDTLPLGQAVPIGRALASSYALPGGDGPIPGGQMVAELWLAGPSVTRGYLGDPRTTAARFRPDPDAGRPGGRTYLTGDLVSLDPQGAVVYMGREDEQTKIRGIRVEPGEVDRELLALAGVTQAVTLAIGDGAERRLESWVVLLEPSDAASIIPALRRVLPEPMIPARVHVVDAIPRTPGGKSDRAALLRMRPAAVDAGRPPDGAIEVAIATAFEQVLGKRVENAHASFFDLGGHSLLAVVVIGRLRDLGLDLDVQTFFHSPSVARLAEAAGPEVAARIEVLARVADMSDADVARELERRISS